MSVIQKIIQVADKKKSEIKKKSLKPILLSSSHHNKNKAVVFATIVDQSVFYSKREPRCPYPPAKTIQMCSTSSEKNKSIKNIIFFNIRWHFGAKQVKGKLSYRITGKVKEKTICMSIQKIVKPQTITSNQYDGVEQDKLVQYRDYDQPWKLDSEASGHYCGKRTGVRKRRKKSNDIAVQVADGKNMGQVEQGVAPFNKLPQDAADVQIFPHMPNPLMNCGKIVKKRHKIILDDPIATVINKATNKVVMEAVFDNQTSTWNIYPNGPVEYKFKNEQEVDSLGLGVQQQEQGGHIIHLANNMYRLTTKKEIVEYYHAVAGWPVKKTWTAAIQRNAYAS